MGESKKNLKKIYQTEEVHRVKQSKSRELRAGVLYRGCDCEKTNGLQDRCPRTDCHGAPECLTKPPICGPSEFCGGKHLMKKLELRKALLRKRRNAIQSGHDGSTQNVSHYQCYPAVVQSPVCR